MKKLEKLTLKEMSSDLIVISKSEMLQVIGGGEPDAQSVINECLRQLQQDCSHLYNPIIDAYYAAGRAVDSAGNFIKDNADLIGMSAVALAALAADVYLWWLNAPNPAFNWNVLPNNDGSNLINNVSSNSGGGGNVTDYIKMWTWKEPSLTIVQEGEMNY